MWPGFQSQRRRRIALFKNELGSGASFAPRSLLGSLLVTDRRMWVEFDVRSQSCLRREGFLSVSSVFNSPKKTDIFKLQFDLELSVVS